jgi:hypothetical protein
MGQAFAAAYRRSFRFAEHSRIKIEISLATISRNIGRAKRRSAWRRFQRRRSDCRCFFWSSGPANTP